MTKLSREEIGRLKETIIKGQRVRLIEMSGEDPARMYCGLTGTIAHVDDAGQIHVSWDNGSSLALIPNEDKYEVIG